MSTTRALPAGIRFAGAVALTILAGTPAWSQATEPAKDAAQASDQQIAAPVDAIVAEVRRRLAEPARGNFDRADRAALVAFYADRSGAPLWVGANGFTSRAQDALAEIGRAEDWGLSLAAFDLPKLPTGEASQTVLANAEISLGLAVLQYARHARGGRLDPGSLSQNFDQKPSLRDPKAVLDAVAGTDAPGAYLVDLHPKHDQFQKLRAALLKVRSGGSKPEPAAEKTVRLPDGPLLKPGMDHPDVAVLRSRLKVPVADGARETVYDPALREAVVAFQRDNKLGSDGVVGAKIRAALNGNEPAKPVLSGSEVQRLIANMERWRWMPEDMGQFHVWDNVPEFTARVVKNGQIVHTAKIVVGKVENQTPIFSADMKYVVFHPEWGVPDGIKLKEIAPYLRSSGGGGFFGGFFGADTSVLQRHNLKVSFNGRAVDASQVNWDQVDIRRFTFIQPAGPSNVLGIVKFRFPNKHDVYMHDTPQRDLFKQSVRAFSHGCMRVENPGRLAELLLEEDKGWPAARVQQMLAGGYNNEVELTRQIPVHVSYFTALVAEDGQLKYFSDLYGHDKRVIAALEGKALPLQVASGGSDEGSSTSPKEVRKVKSKQTSNDPFNGLFGN